MTDCASFECTWKENVLVSEEKRGGDQDQVAKRPLGTVSPRQTLSHNWAARQTQNQPRTDSPRQNIEIC
jgi:hypothetical protein